eukprot:8464527-Prorocentrum_lima.AAC.1
MMWGNRRRILDMIRGFDVLQVNEIDNTMVMMRRRLGLVGTEATDIELWAIAPPCSGLSENQPFQ